MMTSGAVGCGWAPARCCLGGRGGASHGHFSRGAAAHGSAPLSCGGGARDHGRQGFLLAQCDFARQSGESRSLPDAGGATTTSCRSKAFDRSCQPGPHPGFVPRTAPRRAEADPRDAPSRSANPRAARPSDVTAEGGAVQVFTSSIPAPAEQMPTSPPHVTSAADLRAKIRPSLLEVHVRVVARSGWRQQHHGA